MNYDQLGQGREGEDKNTTLKFQPSLEDLRSDLKLLREKLHWVFILNI